MPECGTGIHWSPGICRKVLVSWAPSPFDWPHSVADECRSGHRTRGLLEPTTSCPSHPGPVTAVARIESKLPSPQREKAPYPQPRPWLKRAERPRGSPCARDRARQPRRLSHRHSHERVRQRGACCQAGAQPETGEYDRIQGSIYATRVPNPLVNINSSGSDAVTSRDDAIG